MLYLAMGVLMLCAALIALMFVTLGRQGDERRRRIVEKTSANTFAVVVIYILFCIIEGVVSSVAHNVPVEGMNPLVLLTVIAVIFAAQFLYFKRKFGDLGGK